MEQLADALADALGRSDYALLQSLVTPSGPGPNGWFGGLYASEGTAGMTPQETIEWLRVRTRTGTIEAVVSPRPIRSAVAGQGPGEAYILSTWKNFKGFATSNVELMLRNDAGAWHWSGALFNASAR